MTCFARRTLPWTMIGQCLAHFIFRSMALNAVIGSDQVVFHEAVQRALADPALLYIDADGVPRLRARPKDFCIRRPPSLRCWRRPSRWWDAALTDAMWRRRRGPTPHGNRR